MNLTFLRLCILIVSLLSFKPASAAYYTAVKSGNFSDTATWVGNVVPPSILDTDIVRILGGVDVTLDKNLVLKGHNTEINFLYNGLPNGSLTSLTNYIVVDSGNFRGNGVVDIDSMYVSNPNLWMSGKLTLNKLTLNNVVINPIYSVNITLHKELRLVGGESKIQRSAVKVFFDANADVVYDGGILGVIPGALDVSKGYNLRYMNINYVHYSFHNPNTVNEFEVAVGAGNTLRITTDVFVPKKILLTSGTLKTDGFKLTFGPDCTVAPGGTASISGTSTTSINIQSLADTFGTLRFSGAIGTVIVDSNTNVFLGSDLAISKFFRLNNGKVWLGDNNIEIANTATMMGGNDSVYIVTNGAGKLVQQVQHLGDVFYPVGTANHYLPAAVASNSGNVYTNVGVNVTDTVFSYGTVGFDLGVSRSVVAARWLVSGADNTVDYNLTPYWTSAAEKNGFNSGACFVSNYIATGWDVPTAAASQQTGNMKNIKRTAIDKWGAFIVADGNAFTSVEKAANVAKNVNTYPNPALNTVYLSGLTEAMQKATMYDITGKCVYSGRLNASDNMINISLLPSGIYKVVLDNGATSTFAKQ